MMGPIDEQGVKASLILGAHEKAPTMPKKLTMTKNIANEDHICRFD